MNHDGMVDKVMACNKALISLAGGKSGPNRFNLAVAKAYSRRIGFGENVLYRTFAGSAAQQQNTRTRKRRMKRDNKDTHCRNIVYQTRIYQYSARTKNLPTARRPECHRKILHTHQSNLSRYRRPMCDRYFFPVVYS